MISLKLALSVFGALVVAGAIAVHIKAGKRESAALLAYPPDGEILDIDGTRMHVFTVGTGPDVVLIHGSSGSLRDFTSGLIPALKNRYRVTAIDRPGLGWSEAHPKGDSLRVQADLIRKAAHAVGVKNPIVLGQSYGGAVALAWAVAYPNDLSALVPVSAASQVWPTPLPRYYRVTSSWLGQHIVIPLITAFISDAKIASELEAVFEPQRLPKGYLEHFGAGVTLVRSAMRANSTQRRALLSEITTLSPHYSDIKVPVEIVHGTADMIVGPSIHAEALKADIPGAALDLLQGIGHMPHHVAIDRVVAAIDRAASRARLRADDK